MARKDHFNRKVPLPSGLTTTAIQKAVDYIEKGLADLIEIYLEQANVFSALVGIYKEDWKYEGSTAGVKGGGRTHTFGLRNAATKLRNAAVYQRKDVRIIGGKAVPANGD